VRKFIQRALRMLPKLDKEQIRSLIFDLALENELLEVVLDSMSDGVLVTDENHKLVFKNKPAERLMPFLSPDPLEKLVWSVVKDPEVSSFLKKSLENQERVENKEFTFDKGSENLILSYCLMPLVKDGKIQGNLLHIEDISDRRRREARLRRAESLASLTTLAAGVAHEIKNPLGSIAIHIQLIQKTMKKREKLNKKMVDHHLKIVDEEIERLNGIIVDFLFAVRPMDTHLKPVYLNRIIRELLQFIHLELEEEGITIIEELSDGIPILNLDEKYMKQGILNIVKNASSSMPGGGILTVRTSREGDEILLDIIDTGVGIPEENLSKIFEPYYTTKEFGSGLGLTVVYKIVKEHQGEIALASKKGEGTTFTISLPVPAGERPLIDYKEMDDEV
jgi:PAS domain S-box-containing protein